MAKRKPKPYKVVSTTAADQRIAELEHELGQMQDWQAEALAQQKRADALEFDCDAVADLNAQLQEELEDALRNTAHYIKVSEREASKSHRMQLALEERELHSPSLWWRIASISTNIITIIMLIIVYWP